MTFQTCNVFLMSYGYLQALIEQDGKFVARFYCLPIPQHKRTEQEALWIECEVFDLAIIKQLNSYRNDLRLGRTVFMQFSARYAGVQHFQHCIAPDDPNHLVTMKAYLLMIIEASVNGKLCYPARHKNAVATY